MIEPILLYLQTYVCWNTLIVCGTQNWKLELKWARQIINILLKAFFFFTDAFFIFILSKQLVEMNYDIIEDHLLYKILVQNQNSMKASNSYSKYPCATCIWKKIVCFTAELEVIWSAAFCLLKSCQRSEGIPLFFYHFFAKKKVFVKIYSLSMAENFPWRYPSKMDHIKYAGIEKKMISL